jgi:hypothetical protein
MQIVHKWLLVHVYPFRRFGSTHVVGTLRGFYDLNLRIRKSHWEVHVVKTLLSNLFEKLVGLKGVEKRQFWLQWCQMRYWELEGSGLEWFDPPNWYNFICCFDILTLVIKYRRICWLWSMNVWQHWKINLALLCNVVWWIIPKF